MKFVSTLLMFFGYLLVYAATAASGKFATEPWAGLFADAYTESTSPKVKQKPAPGQPPRDPGPSDRVRPGQGTPKEPRLPLGPVFGTPR